MHVSVTPFRVGRSLPKHPACRNTVAGLSEDALG